MGKDGTRLLRECVHILVLVSTDLVAVRLSGITINSNYPSGWVAREWLLIDHSSRVCSFHDDSFCYYCCQNMVVSVLLILSIHKSLSF